MPQPHRSTLPETDTPATLLNAAHHRDPYPFYAALRAASPSGLHRDPGLGLWVASSAAAVEEVLNHPALRVRPVAEPVPRQLAGTPAGQLFGGLMRQNEGTTHHDGKAWATPLLTAPLPVAAAVQAIVQGGASPRHRSLNALLYEAPIAVLWHLLHPGEGEAGDLAALVRAVVTGWSAWADDAERAAASAAAALLLQRFGGNANRIGLFTQTCEATAGLVGNVLVALQREAGLRAQWLADAALDEALACEVARHDPSVQNTRRFVAAAASVRGHALQAGEAVLVLLASANRDASITPEAERFMLRTPPGRSFTWGSGPHACPGTTLSRRIAMALLRSWHGQGCDMPGLTRTWHYRQSPNGRLPHFDSAAPGASP